jgi:type I restriction enzyme S subunit
MEETKVVHKKKVLAPKLRFNGFTEPWKPCTLGDVTQYTKGFAFKSDDYRNDGVRIIRVSDLGVDRIRTENEKIFISTENINLYNKYRLISGNIIITTVGSKPELLESAVGRGIFVQNENEGLLNQNLLKFENIKDVDNGFLMGQINSKKYQLHIKGIARGNANQANITVLDLLQYKFNIPSYPEQQKIASFLSAVDEKIQLLNRKKQLLEQYKKGVMQQLFSGHLRFKDENGKAYPKWEEKKLGDVLDYIQPTKYLVESTEYDDSYETPVLTAGKTFILGYTNETKNIFKENLPVILFDDFTTATQFVNFPFKAKSSAMKILVPKKNENIRFIYAVMQLIKFEVGGHGRHWISQYALMNISYPCLEEQKKIADFLSAIDVKIESLTNQITQTQNFKKGLLQQMFV